MIPLEDLLQQCTVKITVPGGWGTGFFVAPGLILTCAHVVRKAVDFQVDVFYLARESPLSAIVKAKADDGKTLDLALVELSKPLPDHPCVFLDEEPVAIGQALYSYGYLESYTNAAPVRPVNEGETGDTPPLLKLQGAQIEKGISGAALLNLKTGKVCGMVKETRAAGFDLGSGAIPTRVILEQFPELRSLQQAFHEKDRRWVNLITTQSGIDFQPYREAVIYHYSQQRHLYTPTDALMPLEARSVERQAQDDGQKQQLEKTVEQFLVLEGLRKYALGDQREQVLLAGRPGSGKSTTLRQLAVSLAEEGQVPVLVQLKGDRPVPDLIQAEFRRMKQRVTSEQVDEWLLDDHLVLLLDGVNEIPNDDLRRKLAQFREDNPTVPMIFTTRDLLTSDLGIGKRLQMKPLSEPQMREFVGKYLPEQGDHLLKQLRDRLRELAETPLLLKLLCDVFQQTGEVPQSKGELFRRFDAEYERFKGLPAVSADFRRFKSELLQHLAWVMMQGDEQKPTEFKLAIDRTQAEKRIEQWLQQRVNDPAIKAKEWLEDLLEHHLLQVAADPRQIEFHHQLFQEYYAAEALLVRVRDRHPDVSDEVQFQQGYLNYLKWTEVIAIALSLMQDEAQALAVVRSALEVDWQLGARLAGEVKPEFQAQPVKFVEELEVPDWLKARLLGETRSDFSLQRLLQRLENDDISLHRSAPSALDEIGGEQAIPALLQLLEDPNSTVRLWRKVASALGVIGSKQAIPALLQLLKDPDSTVRVRAAQALGEIGSEQAIPALLQLLEDTDSNVGEMAAVALDMINGEQAVPVLLQLLEDTESTMRGRAARALGKIGSRQAIPVLLQLLKDNSWYVRARAAQALGKSSNEQAIPALLQLLEDPDSTVRARAAQALGEIGGEQAVPALLQLLEDADWDVGWNAEVALAAIASDQTILALLQLLENPDSTVRGRAARALWKIGSEQAIPALLQLLEDLNADVRWSAARALGEIGSKQAVPALLQLLKDHDAHVCEGVAEALGAIGSEQAIPALLQLLEDPNAGVCGRAARALGKISSEQAIPVLLQLLKNADWYVRWNAAEALGKIAEKHSNEIAPHLPYLLTLIPTESDKDADQVIRAIQNRCKFYNYEIWQEAQAIQNEKLKMQKGEQGAMVGQAIGGTPATHRYEVNAEVFQVIEHNHGNVIGKQPPEQK